MIDAHDIRPGTTLESKWDEDLVVTERDGDEIVCEIDGEYSETYSVTGVQNSLDDGVLEITSNGSSSSGGDGDAPESYEPETVADVDLDDIDDTRLYLRFGSIPEGERSWDNRNNRQEDGVSVYACERDATDDDAPEDVDEAYYLSGTMLQTVFYLMTRDTYLVTGEQVGTGADGEPLLRDVTVVAKVRSPKGIGGWVPEGDI